MNVELLVILLVCHWYVEQTVWGKAIITKTADDHKSLMLAVFAHSVFHAIAIMLCVGVYCQSKGIDHDYFLYIKMFGILLISHFIIAATKWRERSPFMFDWPMRYTSIDSILYDLYRVNKYCKHFGQLLYVLLMVLMWVLINKNS